MTTPRQRFGVTSVTGYGISPTTRLRTTWYVLDRAYCHCVVGEHRTARAARRQQRKLNRWDRETGA